MNYDQTNKINKPFLSLTFIVCNYSSKTSVAMATSKCTSYFVPIVYFVYAVKFTSFRSLFAETA